MADNDIEMGVGVKADTKDLDKALNKSAQLFATEMRNQLADILNNVGGDKFFTGVATNKWGTLPYYQSHNTGGQAWTTDMLTAGVSRDLSGIGIRKNSSQYQNAILGAALHGLTPDQESRFQLLRSYGMHKAASTNVPGGNVANLINQDYRLLQYDWSSDFLTKDGTPNFNAMRSFAVDKGIGKWKDTDGKKNADNFEFIDDAVEDISNNADKAGKQFIDWHDTLKGVLGTLTAISGLSGLALGVEKVNSWATSQVNSAAGVVPNTLPFYGMSTEDYLKTKNASTAMNLGSNAVYNDIALLATKRAEFKTFGNGLDVVKGSLAGVFDTINETSDPMKAYKVVAQALADKLKEINSMKDGDAKNNLRAQFDMLIKGIGIGTFSDIAGYLNGAGSDQTVESMFSVVDNPYYGALETAKTIKAEIDKLNTSISASYATLATDWMTNFGKPFLSWWDTVLKEKIIPWFHAEEGDTTDGDALLEIMGYYNRLQKALKKASRNQSGYFGTAVSGLPTSYKTGTLTGIYGSRIRDDSYANVTNYREFNNLWDVIKDTAKNGKPVAKKRATELKQWLKESGYDEELDNKVATDVDRYIARFAQAYLSTYDDAEAQKLMDNFINSISSNIIVDLPEFKELVQFLKDNQSGLGNNFINEITITLKDAYGAPVAAEITNVLQSAN